MGQLGKLFGSFFMKLRCCYESSHFTLRYLPWRNEKVYPHKDLCMNFLRSFIHNGLKPGKKTQIQVSISEWLNKLIVVHLYNGCDKTEWTTYTHNWWMNLKSTMLSKGNQPERLHTPWFHGDNLEKAKLLWQKVDQWLPGAGGGKKGWVQRDTRELCWVVEVF